MYWQRQPAPFATGLVQVASGLPPVEVERMGVSSGMAENGNSVVAQTLPNQSEIEAVELALTLGGRPPP